MGHKLIPVLIFMLVLILPACRSSRSSPPVQVPDVTSEANLIDDISTVDRNIISLRLDEIRLTEQAHSNSIPLDMVWMIPVGTDEEVNARMQYIEEDNHIIITRNNPYTPTSPWFISVERQDLNGDNFGIWFVASNTGESSGIPPEIMQSLIRDVAGVIVAGGMTALLTTVPLPAEILTASVAVQHGRSLIATLSAYGAGFWSQRESMLFDFTSSQVDTIFNLTSSIDEIEYFSEVYIIFSAEEQYFLNNQISAISADGSLEFIFSIFETSNSTAQTDAQNFDADNTETDIFPPVACNPAQESNLTAGMSVRVINPQLNAVSTIFDTNPVFRLRQGDVVETIMPFCDFTTNALWWRIRTESGEVGWILENRDTRVFLEPVDA
ncbi:MAG: hypothetical protein ACFE0Q_03325 [Anaerolineae bacterium]